MEDSREGQAGLRTERFDAGEALRGPSPDFSHFKIESGE